jgi:hypothetical protein
MSRRELSRRSGIPQPQICAIEAGKEALFSSYERLIEAMGSELVLSARPRKPREAIIDELAAEKKNAEALARERRRQRRATRRSR